MHHFRGLQMARNIWKREAPFEKKKEIKQQQQQQQKKEDTFIPETKHNTQAIIYEEQCIPGP